MISSKAVASGLVQELTMYLTKQTIRKNCLNISIYFHGMEYIDDEGKGERKSLVLETTISQLYLHIVLNYRSFSDSVVW